MGRRGDLPLVESVGLGALLGGNDERIGAGEEGPSKSISSDNMEGQGHGVKRKRDLWKRHENACPKLCDVM